MHCPWKSEWCHSGIIEHFDIFKMASKMEVNYKWKKICEIEKCLNPIFFLKLLAMKLESSWRHLAYNQIKYIIRMLSLLPPRWQFITKKYKKIFPETDKLQGFACKMLIFWILNYRHHPCKISVMLIMYHSEFDIFKIASRLVSGKFYIPVGMAPYL